MKAMVTINDTTGSVDLTFWKDEDQRISYAKSIAGAGKNNGEHIHFNVYDVPEN